MFERSDLHDPELAAALSRRAIAGPASPWPQRGGHASRLRGASLEFAEHTEYSPGDDLKHLDWKVYAKTDRHYVRRYEDERLSRVTVVLDASSSMAYGGEAGLIGSKFQLAAKIAVALISALLRQGDAAGLLLAGPEPFALAPRPGAAQLEAALAALQNAKAGGSMPVTPACADAAQRLGSSGTLVVVSDFLHEEDEKLSFLAGLGARGIGAKLVCVLHPDETGLPFATPLKFTDLETEAQITLDPDSVRAAYVREIRAHLEGLAATAAGYGAGFALVRSGNEALARLPGLFASGSEAGGAWTG